MLSVAEKGLRMDRIGRYEVIEIIGDGGMGTVHKGRDPRFNRPVAIKLLHDHLIRDPQLLERFKNEAIIQARLQHPNIVTVYDFILEDDNAAMVMEFVEGQTLEEIIEKQTGPMPYDLCLDIFTQVLLAMSFAHAQGLVHRDIKPSNIIVRRIGKHLQIKVMDFGVAKILGDGKLRTATSAKIGTLWYMSAEQIKSPKDVDLRSDIHSLGVTLYQMATGRVPFDDEAEFDLMRKIVQGDFPPPNSVYPGVSPEFQDVIVKAIASDKEDRFQNCEAFLEALQQAGRKQSEPAASVAPPATVAGAGEGKGPDEQVAPPTRTEVPSRQRPRRIPLLIAGAAGLVVVTVIVVLALVSTGKQAPPHRQQAEPASAPVRVERGHLVVRISPSGKAQLDGFEAPDGGQRNASVHRFSNLEPRSYSLTVWNEASGRRTKKNVTVTPGETTELTVGLD